MRGRTPSEVFEQDHWNVSRPTPQAQDLALLMMERERRSVRECAVMLNKRRYIGYDETARVIMHELNECEVICRLRSARPGDGRDPRPERPASDDSAGGKVVASVG